MVDDYADFSAAWLTVCRPETEAEMSAPVAARLHRRLAKEGYVQVFYTSKDDKPDVTPGFFMFEYRRLDNPCFQAIVSMNPKVYEDDDPLQVTFNQLPAPRANGWKRLLTLFSERAELPAPVMLPAYTILDDHGKPGSLPHGKASPSRYAMLACMLGCEIKPAFMIDVSKTDQDFVILFAHAHPDKIRKPSGLKSHVTAPMATRIQSMAVPSEHQKDDLRVYIRARNLMTLTGDKETPVEHYSFWNFIARHQHIIPNHVHQHVPTTLHQSPRFDRI